jgi:outer membrane protein OmpA-like peptidoglycan-associated protein
METMVKKQSGQSDQDASQISRLLAIGATASLLLVALPATAQSRLFLGADLCPGQCPADDRDGDGIPNDYDVCPDQPETVNGFQDGDGCPDEAQAQITLAARRVYFEAGLAILNGEGLKATEQVAKLLSGATVQDFDLYLVGHADHRGDKAMNMALSKRRAEAVRDRLIKLGIAKERIVAEGKGPLPGTSELEMHENRRVELRPLRAKEVGFTDADTIPTFTLASGWIPAGSCAEVTTASSSWSIPRRRPTRSTRSSAMGITGRITVGRPRASRWIWWCCERLDSRFGRRDARESPLRKSGGQSWEQRSSRPRKENRGHLLCFPSKRLRFDQLRRRQFMCLHLKTSPCN